MIRRYRIGLMFQKLIKDTMAENKSDNAIAIGFCTHPKN